MEIQYTITRSTWKTIDSQPTPQGIINGTEILNKIMGNMIYSIVWYKTSCWIYCLRHFTDDTAPKNTSFPDTWFAPPTLENQKENKIKFKKANNKEQVKNNTSNLQDVIKTAVVTTNQHTK